MVYSGRLPTAEESTNAGNLCLFLDVSTADFADNILRPHINRMFGVWGFKNNLPYTSVTNSEGFDGTKITLTYAIKYEKMQALGVEERKQLCEKVAQLIMHAIVKYGPKEPQKKKIGVKEGAFEGVYDHDHDAITTRDTVEITTHEAHRRKAVQRKIVTPSFP